jgi:hypothetical protein
LVGGLDGCGRHQIIATIGDFDILIPCPQRGFSPCSFIAEMYSYFADFFRPDSLIDVLIVRVGIACINYGVIAFVNYELCIQG